MFSIHAFSESQDNAAAYAGMAAVTDQIMTSSGDDMIIGKNKYLVGKMAFLGATVPGNGRLVSPSIRQKALLYVTPPTPLLVPGTVHKKWLTPRNGFSLTQDEKLNFESNSNPAAAEQHACIIALADGPLNKLDGEIITVRGTITLAQVVDTWTYSEMTLADNLPVGNYSVVGATVVAAGGIAFRMVFKEQKERPGGLVSQTGEGQVDPDQRHGGMGLWGDFHTTNLPAFELLGSAAAASATYDVFLDILAK